MFAVGYQYSRGDVITDPSLPITGVDSKIEFAHRLVFIRLDVDLAHHDEDRMLFLSI